VNSLTGQLTIVSSPQTTATTAVVSCPSSTFPNVVSGGFSSVGGGNGQFQVSSFPSSLGQWTVTLAQADDNNSWVAYAVCAK
jgi:hypothetical protein